MTGAEELRRAVRIVDNVPEWFNDRFTATELLLIARAVIACDWEVCPSAWTARQLADALRGHAPQFVETERGEFRAVYARKGRAA